jgi:hypothetical protein
MKKEGTDIGSRNKKMSILVVGVEDFYITLELLVKVYKGLKEERGIEVFFRPHPHMKGANLERLARSRFLEWPFFKRDKAPLKETLLRIDCLVGMSTGALFDGICLGIPVLRVRRDTDIPIDPVDWLNGSYRHYIATTPLEIRERINQIKEFSLNDRKVLLELGEETLRKCFSPPNFENYESFI